MNISILGKIALGILVTTTISECTYNKMSSPNPIRTPNINNKVTILMTVYNEENTIQKSIESLITNNYYVNNINDMEFLIISGYSTDHTENIIQYVMSMYPNSKIKNLVPPYKKKSLTPSRNYGIQNSMGDVIVNVDADTEYNEYFLDYLLSPFIKKNVVGVSGLKIEVGSSHLLNVPFTLSAHIAQKLRYIPKLDGCVRAFKKNVYYTIGGLPEAENEYSAKATLLSEEIEFANNLSLYGDVIFEPSAIGYHYGTWKYLSRRTCNRNNRNSNNQYCNDVGINKIGFG